MLSSLIITFNLIRILHSQNYCIWGKTGQNSGLNGLYTYDSDHNGKPSYIKTIGAACASPTLYLWSTVAGNAWRISNATGSDRYNMQCSQSDLSSCGTNSWGPGNAAVFAQANTCPQWDCESVNTTTTYANCDGPFDTSVGSNAWQSANNMYWYFVPQIFSWICNNALDIPTCPTSYYAIAETGWTDLSAGSNTILPITAASSPTATPSTINCLGTKTPTQSPVPNPTTSPNNNVSPTSSPVGPTSSPVSIPSGTPGSVCIWGRSDPAFFNTFINGLYIYDGESNNNPSYKKTIDCTTGQSGLVTAYLYYTSSRWMIGNTKGSASNYANCAETDISQCTAGKWQVVLTNGGSHETEPNLYTQLNSCPSWDCASVSSPDSISACRSFNQQIHVNAWQGANNYIWWFDPTMFIWKCIDGNTYPNYDNCTTKYSSATMPNTWTSLSNGQQTTLSFSFPPTTTTATLSCSGVAFPSPTAATSPPTSVTPNPVPSPTQPPIQPGTPTQSPIKAPTQSPQKIPTNNPIKSPTGSPIQPGTPTAAPVTPHPTNVGTAKPTTGAPTDDQGTARPTQPTTKAPTSQGATDWDCVSITGLDTADLNGNYNKIVLAQRINDRSSYELNDEYYLYYMYWSTYDKYYWVITQVLGSDSDRIHAYCHEYDIAQCSGITLHNGIQQTNSKFLNCANVVIESTNDNGNNGGGKSGTDSAGGVTLMGWIIIIIGILIGCCCCIIIIFLCLALMKKRKKKQRTNQQFGNNEADYADTAKMNKGPQYTDPYAQEKIYTDDRL